jgi:6-phosphogluconolactonase
MSIHWRSYPSPGECAAACARHVVSLLSDALSGADYATFAVSGGSTPKLLFEELRHLQVEWDRVHLFFVDERAVPPTDPDSNYKLAREHLIEPVALPGRNVHRIHAELSPHAAAQRYIAEIQEFFGLAEGELPGFDILQLGMGADAHTASLFPGDPSIEDRQRIAAAVWAESKSQWRITLLPGTLLAARHKVFLVAGADKGPAVRKVLEAEFDPLAYPAQVVSHHGRSVTWFMDEAAASLVEQRTL